MKIAAIMPCRGRAEQTDRNIARLKRSAGIDFELICIATEPEVWKTLKTNRDVDQVLCYEGRVTYWQGMAYGSNATNAPYLVNLANDLLPGWKWLARAAEAYQKRFDVHYEHGLMGFNDGIHGPEHSPHFLIGRNLLNHLGGWPIWYEHNWGDTEICLRAQYLERYAKSPWAVLYHDHWITGASKDDVYAEGDHSANRDRLLFNERKAAGWPPYSHSF